MPTVLLATHAGCLTFTESGAGAAELSGHAVSALAPEPDGRCLAIVDERQIWRRERDGNWSLAAEAEIPLQSVTSGGGVVFSGGNDEAAMLRVEPDGRVARLQGFDTIQERGAWFAGGPPLGVRSLAATADGAAILAAVHVGGIPRSIDSGTSWKPTIPVLWDVHEVRAHATMPGFVAAAAAVGLCISVDGGGNWKRYTNGEETPGALAVAVLAEEVLFSVQDGPFAKRSQVWRWKLADESVMQVRDGLPEWLQGKVDTGWIAGGVGRAAVVDAGGNLWLSEAGSTGWRQVAANLPYPFGLAIL